MSDTARLNTAPVLYDREPSSLREAVGIAVGASSMCWDNVVDAGVFLEGRATGIVDQVVEFIEKYTDAAIQESHIARNADLRSKHDVIRPEDDPDQLLLFDFDQN